MSLKPKPPSRKQAFRAALALAGMTKGAFAAEVGVSESHLDYVLTGERESRSLTEKIDAFIASHSPAMQAFVGGSAA